MLQFTEDGDSVYVPAGPELSQALGTADTRGPLGRWIRRGEPDYEAALEAQRKLEETWVDARDELGDG